MTWNKITGWQSCRQPFGLEKQVARQSDSIPNSIYCGRRSNDRGNYAGSLLEIYRIPDFCKSLNPGSDTVLDENGGKAPVTPLKASSLGDDASLKKVETILASSPEKFNSANLHKMILHHVEEVLIEAPSEEELCKRLKTHHIDLFLRRNDQNRITGITFIDHENRCVLNGYRLGKEYSANAFNERFSAVKKTRETSRQVKKESNIKLKKR